MSSPPVALRDPCTALVVYSQSSDAAQSQKPLADEASCKNKMQRDRRVLHTMGSAQLVVLLLDGGLDGRLAGWLAASFLRIDIISSPLYIFSSTLHSPQICGFIC